MKKIRLIILLLIIAAFIWFLVISPSLQFKENEKMLEEAGRRYFELNPSELPSGERVKTVTLNTLFKKSYMKKDIYVPYTTKTCSLTDSWVKVKRVNQEYKYYVFLNCGALTSNIDHKGPEIKLKGEKEMHIGYGSEFVDPGVMSIYDNIDGNIKTSKIVIKGKVDTSNIGTYEISYTATDSLNNKTEVTRTVVVSKKLYDTIKLDLKEEEIYKGEPTNNYIRFSNMLFRIYGYDKKKNIILISDQDISNVNYSKLDKWLEYYYDHLTEGAKKLIVKNRFCNMDIGDGNLDITECESFTDEKDVYIPSMVEINNALIPGAATNYLKDSNMTWIANTNKKNKTAFVMRSFFIGSNDKYMEFSVKTNCGVKPMLVIKGNTDIIGGDGSVNSPYYLGEMPKVRSGEFISNRYPGEYIAIEGFKYRIMETDNGLTRVISDDVVSINTINKVIAFGHFKPEKKKKNIIYDPKDKDSLAHFINNQLSSVISTDYFVLHEINVPVYKSEFIYGEEVENKKYEVKLSAPNMYEMFSAYSANNKEYSSSFWYLNSLNNKKVIAYTYQGIPMTDVYNGLNRINVRVVAYLKKDVVVTSGAGTFKNPYLIR